MFESLTQHIDSIFDKFTGRGALTQADVERGLDELRTALLEADVALPTIKSFLDSLRPKAIGAEVIKSITPAQQLIKITHDALTEMLGEPAPLSFAAPAPVVIMMVGLQGTGKTTTTAKIARWITHNEKRSVLLASLDTYRPAAQDQLHLLGKQTGIATLPSIADELPISIAKRALAAARLGGHDVVMLDTAGRGNADAALMTEMKHIYETAQPHEVLLIADSLTGQEAITIARAFKAHVSLTGLVLTRADGDGRGGATLSMRHETGVPIKFLGTGEGLAQLEIFDPARVAGRILGQGDIVGLVERATETVSMADAETQAKRLARGAFTMDDFARQLDQMRKMGGISSILSMLPGFGSRNARTPNLDALGMDDIQLKRQIAAVSSMTRNERERPEILNASRKRRIAAGAGTDVQNVNRLIKMHRQIADMMKKIKKMPGGMKNLAGMMENNLSPPNSENIPNELLSGLPNELPSGLPGGFPNFGKRK